LLRLGVVFCRRLGKEAILAELQNGLGYETPEKREIIMAKHNLPELKFAYDALEPHIDARTMEIHHTKHHQGYVNKLNAALDGHDKLAGKTVQELLSDIGSLPQAIQSAVRNNAGGHANHSFFWAHLSPNGGGNPSGELSAEISNEYGGFGTFKEKFAEAAMSRFGSGWAWLVWTGANQLRVLTTGNQDNPVMMGHKPVLGLDLWEHAYYLNYQNRRADYVAAFWNIVDWDQVLQNFQAAKAVPED
jgi:Fe-Mn family superoxide dismutase